MIEPFRTQVTAGNGPYARARLRGSLVHTRIYRYLPLPGHSKDSESPGFPALFDLREGTAGNGSPPEEGEMCRYRPCPPCPPVPRSDRTRRTPTSTAVTEERP